MTSQKLDGFSKRFSESHGSTNIIGRGTLFLASCLYNVFTVSPQKEESDRSSGKRGSDWLRFDSEWGEVEYQSNRGHQEKAHRDGES